MEAAANVAVDGADCVEAFAVGVGWMRRLSLVVYLLLARHDVVFLDGTRGGRERAKRGAESRGRQCWHSRWF